MKHISTPGAPISRAPLSQAVRSGHLVFTAGIVGGRPDDGVVSDEVGAQTRQALQNLSAILTAAGSSLRKVVKVTVFLRSTEDYAVVNEVYTKFFTAPYPARSTIQASFPDSKILVEIEAVAEVERSDSEAK